MVTPDNAETGGQQQANTGASGGQSNNGTMTRTTNEGRVSDPRRRSGRRRNRQGDAKLSGHVFQTQKESSMPRQFKNMVEQLKHWVGLKTKFPEDL